MPKVKKMQTRNIKPHLKKDILTDMFEHFGIEVIDVTSYDSKPQQKKKLK